MSLLVQTEGCSSHQNPHAGVIGPALAAAFGGAIPANTQAIIRQNALIRAGIPADILPGGANPITDPATGVGATIQDIWNVINAAPPVNPALILLQ
jgi:hypothetical protein